jgi:hypothetical protein
MNNEVEPLYRSYAKQMLDVDELPEELESNLAYAERMIKKVKPCGFLSSTQTIATIIMITNLESKVNINNIF